MATVAIGRIFGDYEEAGSNATLLCPPHPEFGGSRYDVRLERIASRLHPVGFSTLRFDYSKPFCAKKAVEDAVLCLRYLRERHSFVAVVGYSFGAVVASNVASSTGCDAVVLISPLLRIDGLTIKDSRPPKLIVVATRDEIATVDESERIAAMLSPPKEVVTLETDHLYTGKHDVLAEIVGDFLLRLSNTESGII
ncbi:dienelactone hydrolase family protein [Archaeoglobus veneficus]|uniref:Dienelactone hydrolase domain-containing protein n=1 Tax=Archaeoglobus veneficus (strain DSM 11195 / SNP6) TaxID=693661 RepID=F2KQ60_ARCVS|nr:dienelactone hydrolase family protein [Archaeoglobus veneficus]AEA47663.1 hypothetical protein Arcve_1663 [Archaeoglobus veneficus SNP6]